MNEPKVLKQDDGVSQEVRSFELPNLRSPGPLVYQTPALKSAPAAQGQKERRFHYDDLLKNLLSTDEDSEKLIQERVDARVKELTDQIMIEAREQGIQQGLKEGEARARQEFEIQALEKLGSLTRFIEALENKRDELNQAQKHFLSELSFRIAEVILQHEIRKDKEFLRSKIFEIIEKVGSRDMIRIIVHPSQLQQIASVAPELEEKIETLRSVSLEGSDQLGESDCVVETDLHRIDGTIRTQLETLHELLAAET